MRIAFVGKGGSGKTTLTALFAKSLSDQEKTVLAIDADSNQHLQKVLRAEWLPQGGLKVDVDPNSNLGKQVARLLGTDAARAVLSKHFGMSFALANFCGGVAGGDKKQVAFSPADQIRWQTSIDC